MEDFLRVDGCAHAQQVRGQSFHSRLVVCPADQESHEGSTTPTVYGLIAIHGGNDGNDSVVTIVLVLVLVLVLRCSREGTHSASGSCAPSTRAKYVGVRLGRFHLGIGSILAEIYLCHACSYHEIEDGNGAPGIDARSIVCNFGGHGGFDKESALSADGTVIGPAPNYPNSGLCAAPPSSRR
jgi:hypothetical protein